MNFHVKPTLYIWDNHTWLWYIVFFMYCWIWLVNALRILHLFSWGIVAYNFLSCNVFQGLLLGLRTLHKTSLEMFLLYLCNVCIFISLNVYYNSPVKLLGLEFLCGKVFCLVLRGDIIDMSVSGVQHNICGKISKICFCLF